MRADPARRSLIDKARRMAQLLAVKTEHGWYAPPHGAPGS
jgi:hypothetical protein